MNYVLQKLGIFLKKARLAQNLSQVALARKSGLPQGHLSKIERGQCDLRTTNLIELSRLLGLEIMFIPKHLISPVSALIRGSHAPDDHAQRPAYRIDEEDDDKTTPFF